MAQKYDIFISYRRKGGVKDARLVDEKLRNSGYSVSFDIDTLGRGKFTDTLRTRLQGCKDFVVIFEPSYYERFYDEHGHVQPQEVLDEDWCYLELKNALQMEKNVIPLVHKDFIFPGNLPKEVRGVTEMNAIQLTEKEFKEIFEYKVKAYLISKPKFTYRYRKSIMTTLTFAVLALILYLVNLGMDYKNRAEKGELQSKYAQDSIKNAAELEKDLIKKAAEAEKARILDSVKTSQETRRSERQAVAAAAAAVAAVAPGSANQKIELYWVSNGEETGKILFDKLSRVGLKTSKCSGNGIKVSASKYSCKPNAVGVVKCTYNPQLITTTCAGAQVDIFTFGQTFNGSNKDEVLSKGRMLEDLQNANFNSWVNQLQAMKR